MVGLVVRALDGPLAPFPCASRTQYHPCDDCDVESCQVRHMMLDVRDAIAAVLEKTTLAEVQRWLNRAGVKPTCVQSRCRAPIEVFGDVGEHQSLQRSGQPLHQAVEPSVRGGNGKGAASGPKRTHKRRLSEHRRASSSCLMCRWGTGSSRPRAPTSWVSTVPRGAPNRQSLPLPSSLNSKTAALGVPWSRG